MCSFVRFVRLTLKRQADIEDTHTMAEKILGLISKENNFALKLREEFAREMTVLEQRKDVSVVFNVD